MPLYYLVRRLHVECVTVSVKRSVSNVLFEMGKRKKRQKVVELQRTGENAEGNKYSFLGRLDSDSGRNNFSIVAFTQPSGPMDLYN